MSYRALDADAIIATCERLNARIGERFRESGLSKVSVELLAVARETTQRIQQIRRPRGWIRFYVAAVIVLILGLVIGLAATVPVSREDMALFPLLQVVESAVNDLVFLGIAVFFLSSLETRLKRRDALRALHQLRSLAHVVDMHQLTKDPEQVHSTATATASSPRRTLSRFELGRYLDYCTEMLAIISKIAALYAQDMDDPQVLGAVNDIQGLATGLSANIWQKIMIVDTVRAADLPPHVIAG